MKRHKIDFKTISKMDSDQMKKVILNISLLFSPNYEPRNKDWLKGMSLKTMIYNPRTQTSWFLACLNNPPREQ